MFAVVEGVGLDGRLREVDDERAALRAREEREVQALAHRGKSGVRGHPHRLLFVRAVPVVGGGAGPTVPDRDRSVRPAAALQPELMSASNPAHWTDALTVTAALAIPPDTLRTALDVLATPG